MHHLPFLAQVLHDQRHHADGEIARDAAADLEKSDGLIFAVLPVPLDQRGHLFQTQFHDVNIAHVAAHHVGHKNISQRGILPARGEDGQIFLTGGIDPGVFRIDLVELPDIAVADELIHVFVGEVTAAFTVGLLPVLQHLALDAPHGFFFGNARIGHAIQAALAQRQLFVIGQIAVVGNPAVVMVRDEIENVLFQVGARGANGVHFFLADHLCKRQSEFRGAHRAGHGQQHFSSLLQVAAISFGGIDEDGGIEVPVVVLDELWHAHLRGLCFQSVTSQPDFLES